MTKRIIVASQNPVKLEATRLGFTAMFPGETFEIGGVSVDSGVGDQPLTRADTLNGALNRARNAQTHSPGADYYVGVEGGVEDKETGLQAFAWVVVLSGDRIGKAQTGIFYLPEEVAQLVRQGLELGDADDRVFNRSNSKQQNGAIGLLTDDAIDRTAYYVQAVIMALIPFKNPQLSWSST